MIILWMIVLVLAVVAGLAIYRSESHAAPEGTTSGWVYFLSPVDSDEERPEPIKIGMTHRDPRTERLPEIETMSPTPLKLLFAFGTDTPAADEAGVHRDLAPFRLHGEWFERYPTLAYIDELKEGA